MGSRTGLSVIAYRTFVSRASPYPIRVLRAIRGALIVGQRSGTTNCTNDTNLGQSIKQDCLTGLPISPLGKLPLLVKKSYIDDILLDRFGRLFRL